MKIGGEGFRHPVVLHAQGKGARLVLPGDPVEIEDLGELLLALVSEADGRFLRPRLGDGGLAFSGVSRRGGCLLLLFCHDSILPYSRCFECSSRAVALA